MTGGDRCTLGIARELGDEHSAETESSYWCQTSLQGLAALLNGEINILLGNKSDSQSDPGRGFVRMIVLLSSPKIRILKRRFNFLLENFINKINIIE